MNYYNEIKNKLISNEIYNKVKDYSKDRNKIKVYYEIGELLFKAGKEYGKNIIKQYSEKLVKEVGNKYNERNLRYMRQFYEMITKINWNAMCSKLSWSHYREVLSIKNENEIIYYLNKCENENLTQRQLSSLIKNNEYQRLPEKTKNKLINNEKSNIIDYVKNPIILKNINYSIISEKILQRIILEDIPSFLKELGFGFSFIDNEYKIKIGENYNYIDLLLYNFIHKCYVVVELKVTKLKKGHIGQIEVYMNYINENIKTKDENDTLGIIICKEGNDFIIRYCSNKNIVSTNYVISL